ncbi:hypothetical protein [Fredinandcohnia sp. 179-A 10B2 NHS]|uniref:hypothetical protein n=1 Tax=Fredinandcohnia sp. 179-A 10B2 NHS TaxID=3235176 RepID=UPI0039A375A8
MNSILYHHLYESYKIVQELLKGFPVNNNPLEMILSPLFYEQQVKLWEALLLLQQSPLNTSQFREIISVLYRSNEAFDPTYRAWIRASRWMDTADSSLLEQKKELAKKFREHLRNAVPPIQQIYGNFETRFIIPPLFRSEPQPLY